MKSIPIEDFMVLDIETAAACSSYEEMEEGWQQLWFEKVKRQLPEDENAAMYYQHRAGVMAEFGKVICICIGRFAGEDNSKLETTLFYGNDEKVLLSDFIHAIKGLNESKLVIAGHNIKEFDIPFLCRRMLVNNIEIPACMNFQNSKPWESKLFDTFQYWRFGDYKNFTSLKLLAKTLNVPSSKDDIDGSMVGALYWESNALQQELNMIRIADYCRKDVIATANIILTLLHKKKLPN